MPDVDNYYLVERTDTQFSLGDLGFEANGVSFQTRAKDDPSRSFFTSVGVYVRSGDGEFVEAVSKRIAVGGTETLHFKMQNADVIVLTFGNSEGEFYLSNTVVNPTYSLRFNAVRFIVIALAAALIFALIKGGRGRRIRAEMTEEQAKSLALAVCVAACAVFSCLSVAGADGSSVAYPLEGYIENYNPYVQQFDAFQKGQLHIDVEPEQELLELVAVGKSLPGIMITNITMLFGYQMAGVLGGVLAVLGIALPAVVVLSLVTLAYGAIKSNYWVWAALQGVQCAVVPIIGGAAISLGKEALKDQASVFICLAALAVCHFTSISNIVLILAGVVAALVWMEVQEHA